MKKIILNSDICKKDGSLEGDPEKLLQLGVIKQEITTL